MGSTRLRLIFVGPVAEAVADLRVLELGQDTVDAVLEPSARELPQHARRDTLDLGQALDRVTPFDTEPGRELVPEVGLIEVAASEPVAPQRSCRPCA